MNWINNISLRTKLILLVLPAVSVLLFLFSDRLYLKHTTQQQMSQLLDNTQLLYLLNPVVAELQKERGRTAIVVGNRVQEIGRQALEEQRRLSDQAIQAFSSSSFSQHTPDINQALARIVEMRKQVDARTVEPAQALGTYTQSIAVIMLQTDTVLRNAASSGILRAIAVYHAMANMAEFAGQERAVGSAYIRVQNYQAASLMPLVLLQGKQASWQQVVVTYLGEPEEKFWRPFIESKEEQDLIALRKLVNNTEEVGKVDAVHWFNLTTARLDKLNASKEQLLEQIVNLASKELNSAQWNFKTSAFFMLLILSVIIFLGWVIIAQLNRQMRSFARALRVAMRDKNLNVSVKTDTRDEIGLLSNSVDKLYSVFSKALKRIDAASIQLASGMERNFEITSSNSRHINKQQQHLVQTVAASEQMAVTATQISQKVAEVAEAAFNVRDKSENGEEHVLQSLKQIRELAGSVSQVDALMDNLQERSASMIQVIDVIRNLAEQTNLLALNAAIEAARAGEQGRGFAVVADEVRTLASQTHASTQQIQDIINSFTGLANNAATSIQESHQVAENTLQLAEELELIFNTILQDVKNISDMSAEIATAAEEQAAVSQEVTGSLAAIQQDVDSTYQGALAIQEVTEQQTQLAEDLKVLAGEFKTRD